MNKIKEISNLVQAGARNNKYRVLFPTFGNEIDILCNAASMPGAGVSTVEVFLKGRKYQLAGEMEDEGTWEMTFYNVESHIHRRFFLQMAQGVHNFTQPAYMGGSADSDKSFSGIYTQVKDAYNDLRSLWSSAETMSTGLVSAIQDRPGTLADYIFTQSSGARPWYQQDIVIQQLDHNDTAIAEAVIHNAFVTNVSKIDFTDQIGEISTTTVTLAWSGVDFY